MLKLMLHVARRTLFCRLLYVARVVVPARHMLRGVACFMLHSACCMLHAGCCVLHARRILHVGRQAAEHQKSARRKMAIIAAVVVLALIGAIIAIVIVVVLAPTTSAPGLGPLLPHLRRDWAHPLPHLH
jgi:hypothetical protein